MDGHQIVVRQQVRAELEIVLEIKGSRGLEAGAEGDKRRRVRHLLHGTARPELPVGVLGYREPRCSPVPAVVAVRVGDARHGGGRVRMLGIVICRHVVWSVGEAEGGVRGAVRFLFNRAVVLTGVVPSMCEVKAERSSLKHKQRRRVW